MRKGGSSFIPHPLMQNKIIDETFFRVESGARVRVLTRGLDVTISGPTCHDCCDTCGGDDDSTHRYTRVTLGTVFNKLRRENSLPSPSKILSLWYINRYKPAVLDENEEACDENSDEWWYRYVNKHYPYLNFVSCTLFDEERDYNLYTRS